MEGNESEALNLKPQLFINEVLNSVDDLVDGAFDFFHQEASTLLNINGSEKSADLKKGVDYINQMIQVALDKRLGMWEKYCLRHCFATPSGFSLSHGYEPDVESLMDEDVLTDQQLDTQLDSLRNQLAEVGKESVELNQELRMLDQSIWSDCFATSMKEVLQMHGQYSVNDLLQEMVQTASELSSKAEKLKTKWLEENEHERRKRIYNAHSDMPILNISKDLLNMKWEDLQVFAAGINNVSSRLT
ncbi:hypothetical protein Ancab_023528 [Ancistrocladus abbreviatus]